MVIRLLIFVQEVTFADALATRLEAEPGMEVVAALYLRDSPPQLSSASQADVVLLDGDLPGDAAFRLCEELRQRGDTPRIVFLSQISDPRRIARAIVSGAVGWVRKDESLDRLIEVIHGTARGETWLSPSDTGPVLRLLMGEPDGEDGNGAPWVAALTCREREVLACLAEGANRADLAVRLHMSPNTARTHLQNLMGKLGVHSALEAAALMRAHLDASSSFPSGKTFSLRRGMWRVTEPLKTPIASSRYTSDEGGA
jgi:DNA-binding NarL/FixJ family response regulator